MLNKRISRDTAKLAKERGFDIPTPRFYTRLNEEPFYIPSQSELQWWLREERGWHVVIIPTVTGDWTYKIMQVFYKGLDPNKPIETPPYKGVNAHDYSTYEEALEEAMIEILNQLPNA